MKTILKLIIVSLLVTSCSTYNQQYSQEQKLKMLEEYLISKSSIQYQYRYYYEKNPLVPTELEKEIIIQKKLGRKPKKYN